MRRKSLTCQITHAFASPAVIAGIFFLATVHLQGREVISTNDASKFLGAASCATSSCHGGGGQNQNQFLVWSLRDFHSQRPFATLTSARSKQIADALPIKDPTVDSRCTVCHAPLQELPEALRGEKLNSSEGVSCESCHGSAEGWLRRHTRPDFSHADRVAAGMRDLKNLYVRANTCVACHQTVETSLLKAGHPELIFELDGQSASQPRHWREKNNKNGVQGWLVGQAAALREMSWQLARSSERDEKLAARCNALLWLLQKLDGANSRFPRLGAFPVRSAGGNYPAVQSAADQLARSASEIQWSDDMTFSLLNTLAKVGEDFRQPQLFTDQHARRAERLVLALDRLLASTPQPAADTTMNELFKLTQSLPDFDPARFSATLDQFARAVTR